MQGVLALLLLLNLPLRAQGQDPVFRFEVRLVQIEVRVTRDGQPLKDLKREDFVVKEDGEIQDISRIEFVAGPETRQDVQPPSTTPESADPETAQPPPSRDSLTWIYILPEVQNAAEFRRSVPAIREFLNEQIQPGFLVSLGGLPFTNKLDLLLATLDRMVDEPYGGSELKGTVDPTHFHLDDLQFQRQIAAAMQQESDLLASPGFSREPWGTTRMDNVAMFSVEKVDRQISFFGRMALLRYLDLIEKLAVYPGKKIIVLFRSGFRLDPENTELIQQLAAASIRHRVSLYVGDSRGLAASVPVDDRKAALGWSHRRSRRGYDMFKDQQLQLESKDGLVVLARETGGKVIIDSNDMGEVLDAVSKDASGYYVLGYYPSNLEEDGRFRKLEVKVNLPDMKLEVPRGYYERKPIDDLSGNEKEIYLRQVMNGNTPVDFPLSADYSLFAEEGGEPVIVFSVGALLGDVTPKKSGRHAELSATVMMRFSDRLLQRLPLYLEQKLDHRMEFTQWEASRGDVRSLLAYSSQLPLSPGLYDWKIVVLDENSGELGSFEMKVAVPDFSRSSSAGTLLLTREIANVSASEEESTDSPPVDNPLLEAGDFVYLPQPSTVFRQGDPIHILFHLYNPTEADEAVASRGMQIGILRDAQPVTDVEAYGTPYVDREEGVIRYTASINTATLEAGNYTLMAVLPNYQTRRIPHLEKEFTVLPARVESQILRRNGEN
jgi:VWFA-related protein